MSSDAGKVGEAYVELRYQVAPGATTAAEKDLEQSLTKTTGAATKAGRTVGDALGSGVEHGASRGRVAMGLLARTFVSSSAGALWPLQEIADKFEVIDRASEATASKVGGRLLGIGAAAVGAGSFLQTLASRDEGAQNRLAAAIKATGKDISDYQEEIDKVIKGGERFGYQSNQTLDALQALTIGLHDPKKALEELGLTQDIAAAKQISLSSAADIVRQAYNGNTRVLKQFGLTVGDVTHPVADLGKAQTESAKTADALAKAQQAYTDKLTLYEAQSKHTLAGQIALKNAHDKLVTASDANAAAQDRLKKAQDEQTKSASTGAQVLDKIAKITAGQASASADTFTGKLKALGAKIEDTAAGLGKDYGGALNTAGIATIAFGTLVETGAIAKLSGLISKLGFTGGAFKTLRDVEVTASAEGAAAVEAGAAASSAALVAEGDTALATAGKVRTALGLLGGAGLAVVAVGVGVAVSEAQARNSLDSSLAKGVAQYKQLQDFAASVKAAQDLGVTQGAKPNQFLFDPKLDPDKIKAGIALLTDAQNFAIANAVDSRQEGRDARAAAGAAKVTAAAKKTGKTAGEETLAAFLKSINGGPVASGTGGSGIAAGLSQAILNGQQAAVDAAKTLIAAVQTQFQASQAALQKTVAEALNFKTGLVSSLTSGSSILDALTGITIGTNGGQPIEREFQVEQFLKRRLKTLGQFAAELGQLRKKGLNENLIDQIAQAGPDQGGLLASGLIGSTSAQIGQLNKLTGQISGTATSTANSLTQQAFGKQIAAEQKNTEILRKELARQTALLSQIEKGNAAERRAASSARLPGETQAQATARALRNSSFTMAGL
jgi:hypothetical protein